MGFALVGVAAMICLQVLFRYVLGAPLHYTEEVARYLTIWAALLGASLGVRSSTHFSVRFVVGLLPARARMVAVGMARVLTAVFIVVFLIFGWLLLETAAVRVSPAARIPLVLVYAAVPVSAALMLVFMASEVVAGPPRPLPSEHFVEEDGP
jgi:TRAP-type C4-dicarboxylate transport system permease small subunit